MECPTTLKILKELNEHEKAGTIFNSFGNPDKKTQVKEALKELKQAINRHEKLVDALKKYGDHEPGCIKGDACNCGFKQALESEK